MADPNAAPEGAQPEMPAPQPVFDVTQEHFVRPGGVFPQMYLFLWVSIAFVIGAILPWAADGSMVILQPILLVAAIGATWMSASAIRWRRLSTTSIFMVEFLAFVFLFLYFGEVKDQEAYHVITERERIVAANVQEEIDHYNNVIKPMSEWGFMTISVNAIPATLFGDIGSEDRKLFDHAWSQFGIGFHMSWITTAFVGLFMLFQIVKGFKSAKPKEDPAEARRAARRSGAGKKDDDKGGEKKDEDKVFAANTTMKNVTDGDEKKGGDA